MAILQSCLKDIRAHKRLALRAVVTTILVYHLLWIFVVNGAMMQIQSLVFWLFAGPHGLPGWPPYFDGLTRVLLTLAGAFTGWSVAKLHRPYEGTIGMFVRYFAKTLFELCLFSAHIFSRSNVRLRYHSDHKSHDPGDGRRHGWRICARTGEGISRLADQESFERISPALFDLLFKIELGRNLPRALHRRLDVRQNVRVAQMRVELGALHEMRGLLARPAQAAARARRREPDPRDPRAPAARMHPSPARGEGAR